MADEEHCSRLTPDPAHWVDQLIFQRRSIRRYRPDALPEAWIQDMLACAHQAPSPSNSQPVRFIRLHSQLCRDRLRCALDEGHQRLLADHRASGAPVRLRNWINAYHRHCAFMDSAPVLLAVGIDTTVKGFAWRLHHAGLMGPGGLSDSGMDITIGLALSGLLLKAQALKVGGCVLTAPLVFVPEPEKLLGVQGWKIKCFVTLGFADESPTAPERLPLQAVIRVV